jgi:purine-binding chemotaxis protein CheW
MTPGVAEAAGVPLVVFALHGERFALQGRAVREVVRAVAVAALPDAPGVVEGVINYRGRLAPVLDVRSRFGLPPQLLDPSQHFILADAGSRLVALRVDRALDLLEVPADAIEAADSVAPGSRRTEGVARLPDGLVVIHDLERFLSLDEGNALDAALSAAGTGDEHRDGGAT